MGTSQNPIKTNYPIFPPGETGIGKSTLMDTLFNTTFDSKPSPHNLPKVKLEAQTYELQESNVRLKVSIFCQFL
jgi:septin 6/8/11